MTWWKTQPVFPHLGLKHWSRIGDVPKPSEGIPNISIYQYNPEFFVFIANFINANYIRGYHFGDDYLRRKLDAPDTYSYVAITRDNKIVGFIWSCPVSINKIDRIAYVDLMCVDKGYRNLGVAKILIEHIVNFSGDALSFIHKKDETPLSFPHFFASSHYTIPVANLTAKNKLPYALSNIDMSRTAELYKEWCLQDLSHRTIVSMNWLKSSDEIHIYIVDNRILFGFSIVGFRWGFWGKARLAEVFLLTTDEFSTDVLETIGAIMRKNSIDYLVFVSSPFWTSLVENGKATKSMNLYLHSYNLNIPQMDKFYLPIP